MGCEDIYISQPLAKENIAPHMNLVQTLLNLGGIKSTKPCHHKNEICIAT
jgi:hypothetical protein